MACCLGFYRKYYLFLIHIFLITYGECDTKYISLDVLKLLRSLNNNVNLKSMQYYPIKVYMKSSELDRNFSPHLRTAGKMDFAKDKVQTSKTGKLLRYQHRKKLEELIDFLRERYSSTNYFYNEMKRIQSQYTVKDKMREMIDYCEHPQNYKVKKKILKLFDKLKKTNEVELSLWNEPTNNLVINVLKDPFNDGVN